MKQLLTKIAFATFTITIAWLVSILFTQAFTFVSSSAQSAYPPPEATSIPFGPTGTPYSFSPAPYPAPTENIATQEYPPRLPSQIDLNYKVFLPIIRKSYNRAAAVLYADTWAHDRNTAEFPSYTSYCTNYVSQVLFKGGLSEIGEPSNTVTDWWYRWYIYHYENSNTWSATDWLNSHAFVHEGERFLLLYSIYALEPGDFYLMDVDDGNGVIPDHARVAIGWGYVEEGDEIGEWRFLENQHTSDRKRTRWDYNIDPDIPIWFWHILN